MPQLIHFTVAPKTDAAAGNVRAILRVHIAHESAQALRQFVVHLLAALGGLIALCMLFPQWASEEVRRALLDLWGACAVCGTAAAALEWKLYRQEAELLSHNRSRPEPDPRT
jgi:hypothetical protein